MTFYGTFGSQWMWHARSCGKVVLEIDGFAYDITDYIDQHPGGPDLVRRRPPTRPCDPTCAAPSPSRPPPIH